MMVDDKILLVIRDGYGHRDEDKNNAVNVGDTPYSDRLMKEYPTCRLKTDGESVGLPKGFMGGSEAGHLTIGGGRVIRQNLKKIDDEIEKGRFYDNEAFQNVIDHVKREGGKVHLAGLLQNKGVHAHQRHLFALLRLCKEQGLDTDDVIIHVFGDGRDSPRKSLEGYYETLQEKIDEIGVGVVKTVIGRYYSMDRDTRWDRTKKGYDLLVHGEGKHVADFDEALNYGYDQVESDEFLPAMVLGDYDGLHDEDGIIFYNYRNDRVRQICKALFEDDFDKFETKKKHYARTVMTGYYDDINADAAYAWTVPDNVLGDVLANNDLDQLRISETEKYPHVTFFFNGQSDDVKDGEERIMVSSPREVDTYDEKPEMSIYEITENLIPEIKAENHSLIVTNFVNGDMVGHTGEMDAAVKAVEAVDDCLEKTVETAKEHGYTTFVFADHGNCEEMRGEHRTSHTFNLVDFILVSERDDLQKENITLEDGGLKDVATTALSLMDLDIPEEMTGKNLVKR